MCRISNFCLWKKEKPNLRFLATVNRFYGVINMPNANLRVNEFFCHSFIVQWIYSLALRGNKLANWEEGDFLLFFNAEWLKEYYTKRPNTHRCEVIKACAGSLQASNRFCRRARLLRPTFPHCIIGFNDRRGSAIVELAFCRQHSPVRALSTTLSLYISLSYKDPHSHTI